jgi:hypothetical protein
MNERSASPGRAHTVPGLPPAPAPSLEVPAEQLATVQRTLALIDELQRASTSQADDAVSRSRQLLEQASGRGELSYAAPEQIRGEGGDDRSLVFSVGVILFAQLTGHHPFGDESGIACEARIRRGEFGSGVNHFTAVPPHLRTVLMRALAPRAEERWATLDELRGQLAGLLREGTSLAALPGVAPSIAPPVVRSSRSRPLTAPVRLTPDGIALAETRRPRPTTRQPVRTTRPLTIPPQPTGEHAGPETGTTRPAAPGRLPARLDDTGSRRLARGTTIAPRPRTRRYYLGPLSWAACGAAIASLFPLFLPETPPPASVKDAVLAAPTPAVTTAKPVAAPPARTAPGAPPAPSPVPAGFDASRGGQALVAAITPCFPAERRLSGVHFHLSARFSPDGTIERVFFAPQEELVSRERYCVMQAAHGLATGASSNSHQVASYVIRIGSERVQVAVKHVVAS